MIFTSIDFVLFFTCVYGALILVRADPARRWILLTASLAFYGYENAWYVLLMGAVILWSWLCGLLIDSSESPQRKRLWVAVGVTLSLSALAIFKYADFIARNVVAVTGGREPELISNIILPIGISFYTFHSISYYVDVYRKHTPPTRSLRDYALYIAFFPQLVAGPIVRASQFLPQLRRPVSLTHEGFRVGIRIFFIGAVQKLLLADQVSPFVDRVFGAPALYSTATEWLAVLCYAIQIFGDFSGYTLMAIGAGRILGYQLPENFRMPYLSLSITEFWRRWHMTLSFFLRDYLYISLGGSRNGFSRTQINVMITMLLGGLWHGASWNFVIWGGLQGLALVLNNLWRKMSGGKRMWPLFSWPLTIGFVVLAWIPFRAQHFDQVQTIFSRLFTLTEGVNWFHTPSLVVLAATIVWHLFHVAGIGRLLAGIIGARWMYCLEVTAMIAMLLLFAPTGSSPFIYFQF